MLLGDGRRNTGEVMSAPSNNDLGAVTHGGCCEKLSPLGSGFLCIFRLWRNSLGNIGASAPRERRCLTDIAPVNGTSG